MNKTPWSRILAAMFLVGGTCVGGGMLALPVLTAGAGFYPSIGAMAACALFMGMTGLLFLEVVLWMEEGVHILTMTSRMLGPFGKWLAAFLYLLIAYASLIAYVSGVGGLISDFLSHRFGLEVAPWIACGLFSMAFGSAIYFGNQVVGRVNTLLFVGMVGSYLLLVLTGVGEIDLEKLRGGDLGQLFLSMPLLLAIFSYQVLVPSLPLYVGRDIRALRWSVLGGCLLALVVYIVWQGVILGVVPFYGEHGLLESLERGEVATAPLRYFAKSRWIPAMGSFFALFALITSYLGFGLGLFDFFADGLKMERKGWQKGVLTLLVVLPSLFLAIVWPSAFVVAIEATGGFGDAVLNGMIPVAMVWVGRYRKGMPAENRLFGGKPMLCILFLFALFIFVSELVGKLWGIG